MEEISMSEPVDDGHYLVAPVETKGQETCHYYRKVLRGSRWDWVLMQKPILLYPDSKGCVKISMSPSGEGDKDLPPYSEILVGRIRIYAAVTRMLDCWPAEATCFYGECEDGLSVSIGPVDPRPPANSRRGVLLIFVLYKDTSSPCVEKLVCSVDPEIQNRV
jgi:hypothetical protein